MQLVLVVVFAIASFASEFQLCGKEKCSSWVHDWCPNSTYPAPDAIAASPDVQNCAPGFLERYLCETGEATNKFRICFGSPSISVGGIAGIAFLKTGDGRLVAAKDVKEGDVIMGKKGYGRQDVSTCKVQAAISQGVTDVVGNFSFNHLLLSKSGGMSSQSKLEPAIHAVMEDTSYEIVTDCELVWSEGDYFSPLSSTFCGSHQMAWRDYYILATTIAGIIQKTGTEWFDIKTYINCEAGPECTIPNWRSALPPICSAMLDCAKDKGKAKCDSLQTLSNAFVKEHIPEGLRTKYDQSYTGDSVLSSALMAQELPPEESTQEKWYRCLEFWKWNWRSPWIYVTTMCALGAIIGIIFVVSGVCMDEKGDQYSEIPDGEESEFYD